MALYLVPSCKPDHADDAYNTTLWLFIQLQLSWWVEGSLERVTEYIEIKADSASISLAKLDNWHERSAFQLVTVQAIDRHDDSGLLFSPFFSPNTFSPLLCHNLFS